MSCLYCKRFVHSYQWACVLQCWLPQVYLYRLKAPGSGLPTFLCKWECWNLPYPTVGSNDHVWPAGRKQDVYGHSLSVYVTLWVCMSLFECVCVYTVHVVMHVHVHIIMWVCVTCWNSRLSSWFPVNSNLGMRVLVCVHMHTRMGVCMGTVSESDPRKDQNEGLGDRMWSVPSTSSWLIHATWLHSYVCILEIVTRQH